MQNITSIAELKNSIQLLKIERAAKENLLKEQFYLTCKSLNPVNLFKGTLKDIPSSPYLINTIFFAAAGLAAGFILKKIFIGASRNIFRKLFGSFLQFGITNLVAQHPQAIKSFGQFIFQHILHKKEMKSESLDN